LSTNLIDQLFETLFVESGVRLGNGRHLTITGVITHCGAILIFVLVSGRVVGNLEVIRRKLQLMTNRRVTHPEADQYRQVVGSNKMTTQNC